MKLATTIGDFSAFFEDSKDKIRSCHDAGFRYLDYGFGSDFSKKTGMFSEDWQTYLEELKRLADELSVTFVQSHAPMGRPIVKDANYEEFIEGNKHCIECAAALGIPNIVIHSGYDKGLSKEETFSRNLEFYEKLIPTAEKYNVMILIENFDKMIWDDWYWIDNAPDQKELIDYVAHPLVAGCWDIGHGNMNPLSQEEAIKLLGSRLRALHVQDNFGEKDIHVAPYFGTVNYDEVMCALLDIGYEGYFTFESDNLPLANHYRKPFDRDQRLLSVPLSIKMKAEELIYEIGKHILSSYDCFEE